MAKCGFAQFGSEQRPAVSSGKQGNDRAGNFSNKTGLWIGKVTTLQYKILPPPESSWTADTPMTGAESSSESSVSICQQTKRHTTENLYLFHYPCERVKSPIFFDQQSNYCLSKTFLF